MINLIIFLLSLFFIVDLFVNYSTWKSEARFPTLNQWTIREYKNKCWRDVIPLIVIIVVVFYG